MRHLMTTDVPFNGNIYIYIRMHIQLKCVLRLKLFNLRFKYYIRLDNYFITFIMNSCIYDKHTRVKPLVRVYSFW